MAPARIAGLLYVAMGLPAVYALQYVPRVLVVRSDAAATAANVRDSEWMLRSAIGAELLSATVFIFTALALYRLFRDVARHQAVLMVIFVLVSVPITFVAVLPETAALTVLGADYLSVFDGAQRDAVALFLLRVHGQVLAVAQIFWGLWLVPLGILAYRSGFVPRIVGVLLPIAAVGYIGQSLVALVTPQLTDLGNLAAILEAGEISIVVWLLFSRRGAPALTRAVGQPAAA